MALFRPRALSPAVPDNTVIRGSATDFTFDARGQTFNRVYIQIAENKVDAGCLIWNLNAVGGTLTATTIGDTTGTELTSSTESMSIGSTAFNSLTKNNGYRWRVKIKYTTSGDTSPWSDWEPFFTSASITAMTITYPPSGSNSASGQRQLTLTWTNGTSYYQVAARIILYYGSSELYNEVIPVNIAPSGTGSYTIPVQNENGYSYLVSMQPKLINGTWMTASTRSYKVFYETLVAPTISVALSNGYITVTHTAAAQPTNPVMSNDLYRWSPQRGDYILLAEGLAADFVYQDQSAPINKDFWYKIVSYSTTGNISDVFYSDSYLNTAENWYIVNGDYVLNVVAVGFESGKNSTLEELEPLGRTNKVVARHESASREGRISIDIRPEERDTIIDNLEQMLGSRCYILSPYGDSLGVEITDMAITDDIYGAAVVTLSFVEEVFT